MGDTRQLTMFHIGLGESTPEGHCNFLSMRSPKPKPCVSQKANSCSEEKAARTAQLPIQLETLYAQPSVRPKSSE